MAKEGKASSVGGGIIVILAIIAGHDIFINPENKWSDGIRNWYRETERQEAMKTLAEKDYTSYNVPTGTAPEVSEKCARTLLTTIAITGMVVNHPEKSDGFWDVGYWGPRDEANGKFLGEHAPRYVLLLAGKADAEVTRGLQEVGLVDSLKPDQPLHIFKNAADMFKAREQWCHGFLETRGNDSKDSKPSESAPAPPDRASLPQPLPSNEAIVIEHEPE
jgi:hypothetical protein